MHAAAPMGDSVPPAHAGAAPIYLARVSDELRAIVRERDAYTDAQTEALEDALLDLFQRVGDRLAAALGGTPEGETELEAMLAGLTETDAIRAAILSTELEDIAELLTDAGLGDIRDEWFRGYRRMSEFAARTLNAAGVPDADRILDEEGVRAVIRATVESQDAALFGGVDATDPGVTGRIVQPTAQRMLDGLKTQAGLVSARELADRIVAQEELSVGTAMTEANTRMAEFDRAVQEASMTEADPTGDSLLRVYIGPDDRITRPFCDVLINHALTPAQARRLDNAQTGHPLFNGGGYNCRHRWIAVHTDDLGEYGYTRGSDALVEQANAAARDARRKGRRRRRGRR